MLANIKAESSMRILKSLNTFYRMKKAANLGLEETLVQIPKPWRQELEKENYQISIN
jgi:hypothetical protein